MCDEISVCRSHSVYVCLDFHSVSEESGYVCDDISLV